MMDNVKSISKVNERTKITPDVSIVILTYHPDYSKLKRTIQMAIKQKNIKSEIIISDDGTGEDVRSMAEEIFREYQYENYHICIAEHNQGIVRNCLTGLEVSNGKYVILTSPGDVLFDCTTMADFFSFCEAHHVRVCFGNAVYYNFTQGKAQLYFVENRPHLPELFSSEHSLAEKRASFFTNNQILGALYFREREYALYCFNKIVQCSVYMEDHPSAIIALLEGEDILYYDRNIIWYEYQTGISAGTDLEWKNLLKKDYESVLSYFSEIYPDSPELNYFKNLYCCSNRNLAHLKNLIRYPWLFRKYLKTRNLKKRMTEVSESLRVQLQQIMNDKSCN